MFEEGGALQPEGGSRFAAVVCGICCAGARQSMQAAVSCPTAGRRTLHSVPLAVNQKTSPTHCADDRPSAIKLLSLTRLDLRSPQRSPTQQANHSTQLNVQWLTRRSMCYSTGAEGETWLATCSPAMCFYRQACLACLCVTSRGKHQCSACKLHTHLMARACVGDIGIANVYVANEYSNPVKNVSRKRFLKRNTEAVRTVHDLLGCNRGFKGDG